jgi:tetratricopeptide (TPR) repeat protein
MAKNKAEGSTEQLESVESALTRTERFIEENQKILSIIAGAIIVIVAIYLGIKRFYIKPLEKEAQSQIFVAESYFERDSFNLALNGDGNNYGFIDVINEYGITPTGNLAKYYAGVSYLNIGQYEEAIKYLKKYKPKDKIVGAISYGATGDAYMQLGETQKAIKYYLKAAHYNKNKFTSPIYLMKAGYAFESLKEYKDALRVYKEIKNEFPESTEGRNIDKYITRVEVLIEL